MQWYYTQQGKQAGPVDKTVLLQLVTEGKLGPADFVWNENMGDAWSHVSDVPELSPEPAVNTQSRNTEDVDTSRLHFAKQQVKTTPNPIIEARAAAIRAEKDAVITDRRRFWGYSCPNCGDRVHRAQSDGAQKWFGLVGVMFYKAFGSFYCERCGELRRSEFPAWDQVRMLIGTLMLILFAIVLLIFVILLSASLDNK